MTDACAFLSVRRLADLTAAAHGAHFAFDEAEGADVEGNPAKRAAYLIDGEAELRRAAAHLGYGLVPLDDCPARTRIEAARLTRREAC